MYQQTIKRKDILVTGVLALLSVIAFKKFESSATVTGIAQSLRDKREAAISCSPNSLINKERNKDHVTMNDSSPGNKHNGNSCPHQWGAAGLLSISDPRRKKNHSC